MTITEARTILENKSEHTVQEVKDAKKMIRELNKGGDMKKEVPVIAISVGMGKMKKPKKKGSPWRGAMGDEGEGGDDGDLGVARVLTFRWEDFFVTTPEVWAPLLLLSSSCNFC